MSPSSLQEARSPASFGFQLTQLMSWLWALVAWATSENTGWSGLAVSSSLNTRTVSSPQAVAMAPVSRHLNKDERPQFDRTGWEILSCTQSAAAMSFTCVSLPPAQILRKTVCLPSNATFSLSFADVTSQRWDNLNGRADCPTDLNKLRIQTGLRDHCPHTIWKWDGSYQATSYTVRPWYPDRVQIHFHDKSPV